MAFDFGALFQGATRGLAGYRAGQMRGEDDRLAREAAEAERAHRDRVQMFTERARLRQMDQADAAQAAQSAHNAAMLDSLERDRTERRGDADANRERLNQNDVRGAVERGWQSAPLEGAAPMIDASLSALGIGGGAIGSIRAPGQSRFKTTVRGVPIEADETGPVQYGAVGGKPMRYDPQAAANSAAREKAQELLGRLAERDAMVQGRATPYPTEGERSAAADLPTLDDAVTRIEDMLDPGKGPKQGVSMLEAALSERGWWANPAKSPLYQEYEQALNQFMSVYPFTRGGKALTPTEERMIVASIKVLPGDSPEVQRLKLADLRRRVDEVRSRAGRALPGGGDGGPVVPSAQETASWLKRFRERQGGR